MVSGSYDGIEFQMLLVDQWSMELTYSEDEAQPLHYHHDLAFTCLLNPDTNPLGLFGAAQAAAFPNGIPPGIALVALRQRMQKPRKQLRIWAAQPNGAADLVMLQSPLPTGLNGPDGKPAFYDRDAIDGPKVKVLWTKDGEAEGSLLVGMEISTDVPLCDNTDNPGSLPLISNRFTTKYVADDDYHVTIITSGVATFRADRLIATGNTAASLRRTFVVPPVPPGFQRMQPEQDYDSTGTMCRYQFMDVMLPTSHPGIIGLGATQVEVVHTREHTSPSAGGLFEKVGKAIGI